MKVGPGRPECYPDPQASPQATFGHTGRV